MFDVPLKKLVRYGADQSLWFFHRGKNGKGMRPTVPSAEMYHGDAEKMDEVVGGIAAECEREKRYNKEREREGGIMGRGDAAGRV